jgi:hypothetical protein
MSLEIDREEIPSNPYPITVDKYADYYSIYWPTDIGWIEYLSTIRKLGISDKSGVIIEYISDNGSDEKRLRYSDLNSQNTPDISDVVLVRINDNETNYVWEVEENRTITGVISSTGKIKQVGELYTYTTGNALEEWRLDLAEILRGYK